MNASFALVVFIILVALAFDFLNGFHDAARRDAPPGSYVAITRPGH